MKVAYYKCNLCGKIVHKSKREYHLEKEHNVNLSKNEAFSFHHYEIFYSLNHYKKIPIEALDMEV
ncbi:MAG: hypothetical protein QW272_05360 [Candidatus Methanomethylicaceae archaeon]